MFYYFAYAILQGCEGSITRKKLSNKPKAVAGNRIIAARKEHNELDKDVRCERV